MDEALVRTRPLEDLSEWENSLLVGESNATERRSEFEADWRLRVKDSARFEIVLSKTATAIASKPTGFCVRGELSKQASQLGDSKTILGARHGIGCSGVVFGSGSGQWNRAVERGLHKTTHGMPTLTVCSQQREGPLCTQKQQCQCWQGERHSAKQYRWQRQQWGRRA